MNIRLFNCIAKGFNEYNKINNLNIIKDVSIINAEIKLIKFKIDNLPVDLSINNFHGIFKMLLLKKIDTKLEEYDKLKFSNSLFKIKNIYKRTLILVKIWASYEANLLGSSVSLLATYALETMFLYYFNNIFFNNISKIASYNDLIFNFNNEINIFYDFIKELSKIDYDKYIISVFGLISKQNFTEFHNNSALFTKNLLNKKYKDIKQLLSINETTEIKNIFSNIKDMVELNFINNCDIDNTSYFSNSKKNIYYIKHLNIIDPIYDTNNLGKSLNYFNYTKFKNILLYYNKKIESIINYRNLLLSDNSYSNVHLNELIVTYTNETLKIFKKSITMINKDIWYLNLINSKILIKNKEINNNSNNIFIDYKTKNDTLENSKNKNIKELETNNKLINEAESYYKYILNNFSFDINSNNKYKDKCCNSYINKSSININSILDSKSINYKNQNEIDLESELKEFKLLSNTESPELIKRDYEIENYNNINKTNSENYYNDFLLNESNIKNLLNSRYIYNTNFLYNAKNDDLSTYENNEERKEFDCINNLDNEKYTNENNNISHKKPIKFTNLLNNNSSKTLNNYNFSNYKFKSNDDNKINQQELVRNYVFNNSNTNELSNKDNNNFKADKINISFNNNKNSNLYEFSINLDNNSNQTNNKDKCNNVKDILEFTKDTVLVNNQFYCKDNYISKKDLLYKFILKINGSNNELTKTISNTFNKLFDFECKVINNQFYKGSSLSLELYNILNNNLYYIGKNYLKDLTDTLIDNQSINMNTTLNNESEIRQIMWNINATLNKYNQN